VIVEVTEASGKIGYGEGCPRSYVTGESIASCREYYQLHHESFQSISSLDDLEEYVQKWEAEINGNPAAWCAVELAILDVLAKVEGVPVEGLLDAGSKREKYIYSAVLGDSSPASFAALYKQYRGMGFTDFKIKLSDDISREQEKLECLRDDLPEIALRADANNLWSSRGEAVQYINRLNIELQSLEEPISSRQYGELHGLASELDLKIILDESFLRLDQIGLLESSPSSWIVNIRVSKMGGLLRSLKIVDALLKLDVDITVGAQVGETSLLTRAAIILADAAGDKLRAQEGAFGALLLERDLFEPALQFGEGGRLSDITKQRSRAGFGFSTLSGLDVDPCVSSLDVHRAQGNF
jgi:L-alanine-DL-glutamate epimerase-like enolase superfamily enzyme